MNKKPYVVIVILFFLIAMIVGLILLTSMNANMDIDAPNDDVVAKRSHHESFAGDVPTHAIDEADETPAQKAKDNAAAQADAGISLAGTVTNKKTQAPVNAAIIKVIHDDKVVTKATSAQDGTYQLKKLHGNEVAIQAEARGYLRFDDVVSLTTDLQQDYDIALTPIDGVAIHLNNMTGRAYPLSTVTAFDTKTKKVVYQKELPNGTHDLSELTEGPYLLKAVSYDKETTVTARAVAGDEVDLTLKPFARLDVELVNHTTNEGVKEGQYRYKFDADEGDSTVTEWRAITNDTFALENLKPGTYQIEARTKTYFDNDKGHIARSRSVHLKDGDSDKVTLRLTENKSLQLSLGNLEGADLSSGSMTIISQNPDKEDSIVHYNFKSNTDGSNHIEWTLDNVLPSNDFIVAIESADGQVAVARGTASTDNNDISLDLDMSTARKQASNGVDLHFERPKDAEYETPEETLAAEEERRKKANEWLDAIKEQAQWQLDEAERRAQEEEMEDF